MNILDAIQSETAAHLERAAVIDGDRQLSYRELLWLVDEAAGSKL